MVFVSDVVDPWTADVPAIAESVTHVIFEILVVLSDKVYITHGCNHVKNDLILDCRELTRIYVFDFEFGS